jgi:multidrug efflux pump subunit AcrA (membrane-fusion protein)
MILYGRIQSVQTTSLAFELPGMLSQITVEEGDFIDAGKPVARLSTSSLEIERRKLIAAVTIEQAILRKLEKGERAEVIEAARAIVDMLDADLEQATRLRDRTYDLLQKKAISESEYEDALFKAKSLQASSLAAKSRLLELESGTREEDLEAQKNRLLEISAQVGVIDDQIDKSTLLSPFKAYVIERLIGEGAVVRPSQEVITLAQADQFEARFSVPHAKLDLLPSVKSVVANGKEISIEGFRVIPTVNTRTRTVDVVFLLETGSRVFDGQTCSLNLSETIELTCIELPVSAIVPSVRGLWSVYRLEQARDSGDFQLVKEDVTIAHTDGDIAYVQASFAENSLLVSHGTQKLVPGMTVRIKGLEQ